MLLSNRHQFLFVHIAKTGGSSVRSALGALCWRDPLQFPAFICHRLSHFTGHRIGVKFPRHAAVVAAKEMLSPAHFDSLFKFAFVRNPWDRILSCFLNKIKKDKHFQNKHFEDGVMKKFHRFNTFYAGMPFAEFLHAVAEIPDEIADGHFASQYTRLVMNENLVIAHLARFENYRAEVHRLLDKVGIESSI